MIAGKPCRARAYARYGTPQALGMTLRGRPHGPVEPEARREPANLIFARYKLPASSGYRITDVVSDTLRNIEGGPHPILVLVVSGWPEDRSGRISLALEVRASAKHLERKAGLAVVLTGASEAEIRSLFAPLDELGEADVSEVQMWNLGEWTPPTLIIAADGAAVWTGGSESVRKLLYSLLAGHAVDLDGTLRSFRRRSAERDYLIVERDWLSVDQDARATLRVTPSLIDELVVKHVEEYLTGELARGWQEWA